jgi:hypothetical protein
MRGSIPTLPQYAFMVWCTGKAPVQFTLPYVYPTEEFDFCIVRLVEFSLSLITQHAVKMYGGLEVQLHVLLTSELDGGEWSASRPGRFTPSTHWIES